MQEEVCVSEQVAAHLEKVSAAQQDALKAQLQAMVESAEASHLQTIEVEHELACVEVAAQARHQHLEAALDQVRLQAERSESASLARHRDYEMREQLKQR